MSHLVRIFWFSKSLRSENSKNPKLRWLLLVAIFLFLFVPKAYALSLDEINQKVCDRFEDDLAKMAAIMEEVRSRKGIKETRVAYGGIDTPIKAADYQVTYAAEAVAFERGQKFSSVNQLRYSLEILKGKVTNAKGKVGQALP